MVVVLTLVLRSDRFGNSISVAPRTAFLETIPLIAGWRRRLASCSVRQVSLSGNAIAMCASSAHHRALQTNDGLAPDTANTPSMHHFGAVALHRLASP